MELNQLHKQAGEWLSGEGPDSDIVISSRVRLARNLSEQPFLTRADEIQKSEIEARLQKVIRSVGIAEEGFYMNLLDATPIERLFLVERHLISKEHANATGDRGVALAKNEIISIMVNEED